MGLTTTYDVNATRPVYTLDSDPTVFDWDTSNTNADLNTTLYRSDVPSVYFKSGPSADAWTLCGTGSVGDPILVIASANISAGGGITSGSGIASVNHVSTGVFDLTLENPAPSSSQVIPVASPSVVGTTAVPVVQSSSVIRVTMDNAGSVADRPFYIIVTQLPS